MALYSPIKLKFNYALDIQGFPTKDFIAEAIERNEWQFADPDNEVSEHLQLS